MALDDIYIRCPECDKSKDASDAVCQDCFEAVKDELKSVQDANVDQCDECSELESERDSIQEEYDKLLEIVKQCPHCSALAVLAKLDGAEPESQQPEA